MLKRIIAISSITIILLLLITNTVKSAQYEDFVLIHRQDKVSILLDRVTGVEYICYDDNICPRYNEDGSLFTADQE